MFVRDFVHVAKPFQSVAPQFLRDPSWLRPILDEAVGVAAEVSRALEDGDAAPSGASELVIGDTAPLGVQVDRGAVRSRPVGLVVPIAWSHPVDPSWFPPITGDLEIAPIGLSRSELVLSARYGSAEVLEASNPRVVHRVVETGVRAFLVRLAGTLEADHPGDQP
jgi:hypothetical protein